MSGPFHAIGVLRPNLQSVGFGKCDLTDTPTWHSGATLDVLRGLTSEPRPAQPVLFPGNGATTNLDRFIAETPSPLTFCGWSGAAGLPIIAMMPEPAVNPAASIVGPNGPIEACVLSAANTSNEAHQILEATTPSSSYPASLSPPVLTTSLSARPLGTYRGASRSIPPPPMLLRSLPLPQPPPQPALRPSPLVDSSIPGSVWEQLD